MADINITVDTTSIGRARNELDSLGLTVLKQSQTVKRLERYYKQLDQAFNSGKLSAQQYAKGVKQLDAAIDEVSKGSVRASNATKTLSNAQSSAAIAAQNLANAQRMSGKETNRFGMYAQQVGYQVGDFLVQVQSGTSALVAFGQQGTQLAGLLPGIYGALIGIGLSLTTALLSMGSATTELSFNFGKLWEDVKSAFEPMGPLFRTVGEVFRFVGGLIVDAANLIINSFAILVNVVAAIPRAFSVALNRAETRIQQFSESVNGTVYSISANWQKMMDTISGSAAPGFLGTVPGEAAVTALEDFEFLAEAARSRADALATSLENGATATSVLGDAIKNTTKIDLRGYLSKTAKAAEDAGGAIAEELTDAEQAAKDLADTLDGYVINAVESLGSAWGNFVVSGFTDFKSFASNVLDSFKNMLANMIALAAKNQIMLNLGIAGGGVGGVVGGLTGPGGPFGGVGALAGKIGGFGGNLITGAMGFVKSIGAGAKAVGSYLSTAVTGVKSLATLGTALGAVALPIAAVVAAVSFFKKKVKVLDTGLNVAVEGVNAFVTSFETKETKRFFGLSKKVKTSESGVGADVSDPIQGAVSQMQQAVVDAAAAFGYGAESFKNFTYEFRLSLKGLSEEQQMQKINEELTKMGDAFASMIPDVSSLNELLEAAQQRYDLTTRLLQLQGKEEELIARQREAELAAVHPLNRELLVRIHSLEQEKMAAEKAIAAAQQARAAAEQAADAATSAVQTAFNALTASIRASVDTIVSDLRNKLALANDAVTRSRDIFSQLQSALSSRSLSGGVETSKFRQSSALSFLSKGNFQDVEALKEALDVVGQPTEELYGSFEEYARNFFKTSAVITGAKTVAERQLSQDEKQVALLEEQITGAEAQYQIMVDQYGALLGINNSVLSVSQAISNLAKALAAQTAAQQAVDSAAASETAAISASDKATQSINKSIEAASIIDQLYASGGYSKTANQEIYSNWVKYAETQGVQNTIQAWKSGGNLGSVKGYASGGMHSGGVRLVGEDGPELEFTGPSRISSNRQSASMFRDPELRDAIMSLKSEVSGLRSDQLQIQMDISKYTKRSYDIERKWDVEGLPATRI